MTAKIEQKNKITTNHTFTVFLIKENGCICCCCRKSLDLIDHTGKNWCGKKGPQPNQQNSTSFHLFQSFRKPVGVGERGEGGSQLSNFPKRLCGPQTVGHTESSLFFCTPPSPQPHSRAFLCFQLLRFGTKINTPLSGAASIAFESLQLFTHPHCELLSQFEHNSTKNEKKSIILRNDSSFLSCFSASSSY